MLRLLGPSDCWVGLTISGSLAHVSRLPESCNFFLMTRHTSIHKIYMVPTHCWVLEKCSQQFSISIFTRNSPTQALNTLRNSNHSKEIRTIWKHPNANLNTSNLQILTIRNAFMIKAFECQFKAFESKFYPFSKGFEAFEYKFELFERDSKHSNVNSNLSKGIRSIPIQIIIIRKGFEAFESKL